MRGLSGAVLVLVAAVVSPGCVSMMAPSPQMADSLKYVKEHKGQGARQALLGNEAELTAALVEALQRDYSIERQPHALFAHVTAGNVAYAFYFSPATAADQTAVEVVMATNWFTEAQVQTYQKRTLPDFLPVPYFNARILEPGFDANAKEGHLLPLSAVAMNGERGLARKLIHKGADADLAIAELKERAAMNTEFLDKPANKDTYDRANAGVELLNSLKRDATQAATAGKDEARFQQAVRAYQAASTKPQLPEDARRFKVQAEDAAKSKRFENAADLFGKALEIAPWWPEGHFNRAVILGELGQPDSAILEMKRYLRLVPNAPNARAAQDKIYLWEGQLN